jgi:alpha-L-arabinofuranosidase
MIVKRLATALGLLALCAAASAHAPGTVTISVDPSRVVTHDTRSLTGSCIEDVNHEIYGGLYDQKIFGGSFEEAPSKDGVSGMWDPIATGSTPASFLHDPVEPFNGSFSQRITHGVGGGTVGVANRGLNRSGIAVDKGRTYVGGVYLRSQSFDGLVTVALQRPDGARTYARTTIRYAGRSWSKYAFTLKSNATDPNARFAVWIDKPGTLWVDQAVLMDDAAHRFHGLPIRADIANAMVDEGVTFLRYGGSMTNAPEYRWKNMIGDPDRRSPYRGTWYPYSSNGFGIFDFLNFCEAAHIDAAFAINIDETPQDASDLADYLTAPASNRWGRRRAQDGHPAPYLVRYIEIGNEEGLGGDDAPTYWNYINRFHALARAIHSCDPSLKLVCAAWWRPDSPNVEAVFKAIDGEAAAWDLHIGGDDLRTGDEVDRDLPRMQQRFHEWNPKTSMKAVIFEENGGRHDMQRALGHAGVLNAVRRHGDFVMADCPANCLQPWHENDNGWDQGQVFFTPDRVWFMPPAYAQQMASRTYEPLCVESRVSGSTDLSATATRSVDGKTLVISVVNVGAIPATASIEVGGFRASAAESWTLSGNLDAVNTPSTPHSIRPKYGRIEIHGNAFAHAFPAHSYAVIRLNR